MLGHLSHLERADLLRRLQEITASEFVIGQHLLTARRWFIGFLLCAALIPWTIGLGVSLPRTYVAANWQALWTGFDVVLLGCLSVTAWSLLPSMLEGSSSDSFAVSRGSRRVSKGGASPWVGHNLRRADRGSGRSGRDYHDETGPL